MGLHDADGRRFRLTVTQTPMGTHGDSDGGLTPDANGDDLDSDANGDSDADSDADGDADADGDDSDAGR